MRFTARPKIAVSADGKGLVSQAGGLLLVRALRVTGLERGLPQALGRWRAPRAIHDPGKIITDLAVAVALGGDCLADIAMLRTQPDLYGPAASDPVVSRLITQLALGGGAPMVSQACPQLPSERGPVPKVVHPIPKVVHMKLVTG